MGGCSSTTTGEGNTGLRMFCCSYCPFKEISSGIAYEIHNVMDQIAVQKVECININTQTHQYASILKPHQSYSDHLNTSVLQEHLDEMSLLN